MLNTNSFLASSAGTAIAIVLGVFSLLFLVFAILFIWWVDTKKRPMKEFWQIVGDKLVFFWNTISGFIIFSFRDGVKTVYSDKTLNYSGTEFLPIPTKAPTNQYTYEFVGWDKNGVDENGNIVVRAIYLQKVTMCKVAVFDSDKSTLLASFNVEYGSGINLDDLKPQKNDTKEFSYEFVGWDKKLDAFYGDEKVYAVYNAMPKKYTYKFFEDDGKTLVSEGVAIYGTPIVAPTAPKKEANDKGVFEFAGWRGYENNSILTKDIEFYASYNFTPYGGVGTSSIIKTVGETVKVVEENKLTVQEHSEKTPTKGIAEAAINFDTPAEQQVVTEKKLGSSGVVRKRGSEFIQLNDSTAEKFQKINTGEKTANTDKDVHQKIQLMTIKKTTDVEKPQEEQNVITIKPKKETTTEDDVLKNIMMNKVKIGKTGSSKVNKNEITNFNKTDKK